MIALLFLTVLSTDPGLSPEALEREGRLWEAGAMYEREGRIEDEARIMGRLLEEALYAGHPNRSFWLMEEMLIMGVDSSMADFWNGRLAWVCGLREHACEMLLEVEGSAWLTHRARGLSHLYRGDSGRAVEHFRASYASASTTRRRFYAALDLGFALLTDGRAGEGLAVASFLRNRFPTEGLPVILEALCLQSLGEFSMAMSTLEEAKERERYGAGPADMAVELLEELE